MAFRHEFTHWFGSGCCWQRQDSSTLMSMVKIYRGLFNIQLESYSEFDCRWGFKRSFSTKTLLLQALDNIHCSWHSECLCEPLIVSDTSGIAYELGNLNFKRIEDKKQLDTESCAESWVEDVKVSLIFCEREELYMHLLLR